MEAPRRRRAIEAFRVSGDEFDRWFEGRMAEATRIDLAELLPGPLSEQLPSYAA